MKILAIGNSFSQDATRYLAKIAKASGETAEIASLYIGGCSLYKHFRNMKADAKAYELIWNGENTGFFVSIKEALLSREWDIITIQQQSLKSADFNTFEPYLSMLNNYAKELSPKSLIYLHETWGYANGSKKLEGTKYTSHTQMYQDIEKSYKKASESIHSDGIIPCGKLINALHGEKGLAIHRDGYHLSYGLGRYAAGLLWFKVLYGETPSEISDFDLDEPINSEHKKILFDVLKQI